MRALPSSRRAAPAAVPLRACGAHVARAVFATFVLVGPLACHDKPVSRDLPEAMASVREAGGGAHIAPPPPAVDASREAAAAVDDPNRFTLPLGLYAAVRAAPGNVAISPVFIEEALARLQKVARGDTAAQIGRVLRGIPPAEIEQASRTFGQFYDGSHGRRTSSWSWSWAFVQTPHRFPKVVGETVEPVDFLNHPREAYRKISGTVIEREGYDESHDFVPVGVVPSDARLVLAVSSVYYGNGTLPFDQGVTAPSAFYASLADKKTVPTMKTRAMARFASTDEARILDLPLQNKGLAMTFVLPQDPDRLSALEESLSPAVYERWMAALTRAWVEVQVPRFTIGAPQFVDLKPALIAMGMPFAFDPAQAEFDPAKDAAVADDRMFLSNFFHRAHVEVSESYRGAVGDVPAKASGSDAGPLALTEFRADHPFLFFLRNVESGAIVCLGRVTAPSRPTAGK